MNISKAHAAHLIGLETAIITVEVDITNGLHSFSIIGLGDRSVDEAKDRISAAIKNSGYISPKQKNQKVVISLAPADIKKEGTSFDIAMAMAYLKGSGDIDFEHENTLFIGELGLEGSIRKTDGILPILMGAAGHGYTTAFIPEGNATEASLAKGIRSYAARSLGDIIDHFQHKKRLHPIRTTEPTIAAEHEEKHDNDMRFIRGNETAKRALEIAVAGFHNIVFFGPPGTGKTLLAKSASSIMPALSIEHSIEVTGIHSAARALQSKKLISMPPFRSPHHTSSATSILGGGQHPRPGEATLAHRGILYLDELPEFDRDVIDALRQPLEEGSATISRAKGTLSFPARFMLIASMNTCRCGKKGASCSCSRREILAYKNKISGPIADRIDLWVEVSEVDHDKLSSIQPEAESSISIRSRIEAARSMQRERFDLAGSTVRFNSDMKPPDLDACAILDVDAQETVRTYASSADISARAHHRIIKVARTIADLDESPSIKKHHVLEALQFRKKTQL